MKNNSEVKKDVYDEIKQESLLNVTSKSGDQIKVSRHLKRFFFLISLVVAGILFKSCIAGFVATEPSYVEFNRPPQPSHAQLG